MYRTTLAALVVSAGVMQAVPATAAGAVGPSGLALAGVVAPHSPLLSAAEKHVIAELLDGHAGVGGHRKIIVRADLVKCRVSSVDITARSCTLTFGVHSRSLTGRSANEVDATMSAVGVPNEGAAGSIYETITKLVCTLSPHVIAQRAGGGANCRFQTGP